MRCPTCNAETTEGARFCRSCGALLVTNPEKTAASEVVGGGVVPPAPSAPLPTYVPVVPVPRDERRDPAPVYGPGPRNRRFVIIPILIAVVTAFGVGTVIAVVASRHHDVAGPVSHFDPGPGTQVSNTLPLATPPPTTPPTTPITSPRPGAKAINLINILLRAEERHDWNTARGIYDFIRGRKDKDLNDKYSNLRNQRAYFAGPPQPQGDGSWTVRFTLVAHNEESGKPYTFSVCETWNVNVPARSITAVDRKAPPLTSRSPGDPGWNNPPVAPTCP